MTKKREKKVDGCEHKKISFFHIAYVADIPCEWTSKCMDCRKILGFVTNSFRIQPIPIGI